MIFKNHSVSYLDTQEIQLSFTIFRWVIATSPHTIKSRHDLLYLYIQQ